MNNKENKMNNKENKMNKIKRVLTVGALVLAPLVSGIGNALAEEPLKGRFGYNGSELDQDNNTVYYSPYYATKPSISLRLSADESTAEAFCQSLGSDKQLAGYYGSPLGQGRIIPFVGELIYNNVSAVSYNGGGYPQYVVTGNVMHSITCR